MAIVSGLGIDVVPDSDMVSVTFEIIVPAAMRSKASTGGSGEGDSGKNLTKASWVIANTGETIFDAERSFHCQTTKRLFFSHAMMVVIGRKVAERGVRPYLDVLVKDSQPRLTMLIAVCEGEALKVFKDVRVDLDDLVSMKIRDLLELRASLSGAKEVTLKEFLISLLSRTTSAVAPYISIYEDPVNNDKTLRLEGLAVFKRDRMVGTFDEIETKGLQWIKRQMKSVPLVITSLDGKSKLSLDVIHSGGSVTAEVLGGRIRIKVEVIAEGRVKEQMCTDNLLDVKVLNSLERRMAEEIRRQIESAVVKAKELNADVFGFGDLVHRSFPREWKNLEERWDELFREIEVEVVVKSSLSRTGLTLGPLLPN